VKNEIRELLFNKREIAETNEDNLNKMSVINLDSLDELDNLNNLDDLDNLKSDKCELVETTKIIIKRKTKRKQASRNGKKRKFAKIRKSKN
jgi:hypothetical protein